MPTSTPTIKVDPTAWTGYSGESVTGAEAADHLAATLALLEQRGWSRTWDDTDPELPNADETTSVKAILLSLLRLVRSMNEDCGPLTLSTALGRTQDAAGDQDTHVVVGRILNALVAARTGAPHASHNAWVTKRTRTWSEVRDLLTAGIDFARTHGPTA